MLDYYMEEQRDVSMCVCLCVYVFVCVYGEGGISFDETTFIIYTRVSMVGG